MTTLLRTSSVIFLAVAGPLAAHHGSAAFDESHVATMTGVVAGINWLNPHVEIALRVTGQEGNEKTWTVEAPPPNTLRRLGWQKDDLKSGDGVTMNVWVARDGGTRAEIRAITFPDGHTLPNLPYDAFKPIEK